MTRRRTVGLVLLVVAAVVLPELAVVTLFCLKAIGAGDGLDWITPAVAVSTIPVTDVPVDWYQTLSGRHTALIVHGVNTTGKDSPHIRRLADALARIGLRVVVPDFPELRGRHVQPFESARVVSLARETRADALLCFSFGCGPALIAASHPDLRDQIRFVFAFGGYFDLRSQLEHIVTSPPNPSAFSKWEYLETNPDFLPEPDNQAAIRAAAAAGGVAAQPLNEDCRSVLDLFHASGPDGFASRYQEIPEAFRERVRALSPSEHIEGLRARLIVLHGRQDPCVPASESERLVRAARERGLSVRAAFVAIAGHTTPQWPDLTLSTLAFVYVPEGWRLWWIAWALRREAQS